MMPAAQHWAWAFQCVRSLEAIGEAFNAAGPWSWQPRESAWYGDYLAANPADGVRIRIHAFPQSGDAGAHFIGPINEVPFREGFAALLDVRPAAAMSPAEVDAAFRQLLATIDAANVTAIEPYD